MYMCGEMCRVLGVVCHMGCMCMCVCRWWCTGVHVWVWGVCVPGCIVHLYPQSHVDQWKVEQIMFLRSFLLL